MGEEDAWAIEWHRTHVKEIGAGYVERHGLLRRWLDALALPEASELVLVRKIAMLDRAYERIEAEREAANRKESESEG